MGRRRGGCAFVLSRETNRRKGGEEERRRTSDFTASKREVTAGIMEGEVNRGGTKELRRRIIC